MRSRLLLPLFALVALAAAHGMHQKRAPTLQELAREEIRAREHAVMARNCEPEIRDHVAMRMRRRAEIRKREAGGHPTAVVGAVPPHYTNIQNTTCLTAPEVREGPYYVNNALVRQDIRETQPGVKLLMDFGVLDTTTCTPMNNTFVEIWAANATGEYSGYHEDGSGFNGAETFLRGGWYTDTNGMVEVTTVYPGFYPGRAPHIHLMVHKDWSQSNNGSLVSHSGSLVHVAQFFFSESWNDEVYQTSPYSLNTGQRVPNSQDELLGPASRDGYSPYPSLHYINGNDLSGGLVGYLTLGVDPRSTYSIINEHYTGQISKSATDPQGEGWGNTVYLSLRKFWIVWGGIWRR